MGGGGLKPGVCGAVDRSVYTWPFHFGCVLSVELGVWMTIRGMETVGIVRELADSGTLIPSICYI